MPTPPAAMCACWEYGWSCASACRSPRGQGERLATEPRSQGRIRHGDEEGTEKARHGANRHGDSEKAETSSGQAVVGPRDTRASPKNLRVLRVSAAIVSQSPRRLPRRLRGDISAATAPAAGRRRGRRPLWRAARGPATSRPSGTALSPSAARTPRRGPRCG